MGFIKLGKLFSAMENQMSMHDFWINHIIVSLLLHKKSKSQALNEQKTNKTHICTCCWWGNMASYFETRQGYETMAHPNWGESLFGFYVMDSI